MVSALEFTKAKGHKKLLIHIGTIFEESGKEYVTGGGQKADADRRTTGTHYRVYYRESIDCSISSIML
jgi:hypothetical protein